MDPVLQAALLQREVLEPLGWKTLTMYLWGKAGLPAFQIPRLASLTRTLQNHKVSKATCLTRRRKGEGGGTRSEK